MRITPQTWLTPGQCSPPSSGLLSDSLRCTADPRSVLGSRHAGTTWSPSGRAMWSGKMATRWRRKDGHINPTKGHFLCGNNPDEFDLNTDVGMDSHSTVDHSILAIFEDSSALSEDKAGVEEDSDKLLSALTEMLESVEDDDDNLSPFNTLPETPLLMSQDSIKEHYVPDTCDSLTCSRDDEMELTGTLCQPSSHKVDAEVEVFTSSSLVNLVRIMHSYCLKLQAKEEPEKSSKSSVLFSKEEVWKYERPTEDNDEEINVVSDDEEPPAAEKKPQDNSGKSLKSALVNGSPSKKEKKRVSFGAVTSFDMEAREANHNPYVDDTAPELEGTISSENDQTTDDWQQKPEGKRKPISLQQYRQLKRQPLVEKQGNYITKWPSVPVPPKDLPPILGVHGQKQASFKPGATQSPIDAFTKTKTPLNGPSMKTKASSDLPHKAKRSRPNKIHPVAPSVHVHKSSPTKKLLTVSSDPPNPVLVPLPLQQSSTKEHVLQVIKNASDTKSDTALESNDQSPAQAEELKCVPNTLDWTKQSSVTPTSSPLQYEPPTPVTTPVKETTPESVFRMCLPSVKPPLSSGIEASDLTSLLEQFEETQAKEEGGSDRDQQDNSELLSKLKCVATNPVPAPDLALPTPCTEELLNTLDCQPNLKIPEPLGTEVILSSAQNQPVRRKVPPAKAIQIIDPRPLPFKRTHSSLSESLYTPAHIHLAISADHDYCTVADGNKTPQSASSETAESKPDPSVSAPKQTSEAETSAQSTTQDELMKLTDAVKKTNSDIRLDTYTIPPTPPPSPPCRGGVRTSPPPRGRDRDTRRRRRRSRSSDSDSSSSSCSSSASESSSSSRSGSHSPKRLRRRRHSSKSSSCSSSSSGSGSRSPPRRLQQRHRERPQRISRSRSSSWSRSRSRSRSLSPPQSRRRGTDVNRESRKLRREQEIRIQKLRAIDERRVVYVGRIRRSMTHEELRERFSQFGDVESVSLHFRDRGDHYGFVTFYNMDDAFAAIDNGGKLRRPDELPFDICFGGRRQFCNSDYADLDANRDADASPARSRFEEVDFDCLLKQAQKGLKR